MHKLVLGLGLLTFLIGCNKPVLDANRLRLSGAYIFSDNMMATIQQSTNPNDVGGKLTFVGVKSMKDPKVVFEKTGEFPFIKSFEDEDKIVLETSAARLGKIDTFVIRKADGTFSRVWAGDFVGIYGGASLGVCQ